MKRIKRTNDELKADRPTIDEVKDIPKLPISILVENVRSVHNVGSIFRSADGFGAEKIYLTGYTAYPPREDLSKTALGAEIAVPWVHYDNPFDAVKEIKDKGYTLVLVEQTTTSKDIYSLENDGIYYYSGGWHIKAVYSVILGFIFSASTIWNTNLMFLQSFSWIIGAFVAAFTYLLLARK